MKKITLLTLSLLICLAVHADCKEDCETEYQDCVAHAGMFTSKTVCAERRHACETDCDSH